MKILPLLAGIALGATCARAQTPDKLPDLQVVSVQTLPENPVAGDKVRLRVVIKNAGDAPTEMGTVIGGEFRINKAPIAYTDTYNFALAPGETAVLNASGGGAAGDGTWTAHEGKFALEFLVDDVNRIHESNEDNNDFVNPAPLEVNAFSGPDLIVSRLTRTGSTLRALVQNIGKGATPSGTAIGVLFSLDGQTAASSRLASPLAAGQSVEIVATTTGTPANTGNGTRVLTATVDAEGALSAIERRRDNNSLSRTFAQNEFVQLSPTSSQAFADSIGVCTHLGYLDTSYGNFGVIKARLIESRIRWIRDGAAPDNTALIERILELGKSGIKTNLLFDARSIPPAVALGLAKRLKPALGSVEGQNEPNLFTPELFPQGIRVHQNAVYEALKADPQTRDIPILTPALAFPNEIAAALGNVSADFGAMHPYPGGQLPDAGLEETMRATRLIAPTQALQTTETGYTTAVNIQSGQPGVSERAQAKYLPRQLFEAWNRGVVRTFFYEFADERAEPALHDAEQHFGIIRADGTPKPAFYALRNLISLFSDAGQIAQPKPLRFSLSGETSNLRSSLLQRSDGRRFLVLWINARSFDLDTRRDTTLFSQNVSLRFDKKQRVTVYRPTFSTQVVGKTRTTNVLSLDLDDELTIVELDSK